MKNIKLKELQKEVKIAMQTFDYIMEKVEGPKPLTIISLEKSLMAKFKMPLIEACDILTKLLVTGWIKIDDLKDLTVKRGPTTMETTSLLITKALQEFDRKAAMN